MPLSLFIHRYYGATYVDVQGADRALNDLRQAWFTNDVDLLSRHLSDQVDIQILFDGQYNYTTSTEDFFGMTADALTTTQTTALDFDQPIFLSAGEVIYNGCHQFYDPDGQPQTVYLSYRLRKLGADWYLVAFDTSLSPIPNQYQDFRDR